MNMLNDVVLCANQRIRGFWRRHSFRRAVRHLRANAQKFGADALRITVNLTLLDDRVLLSIHNEGAPIAPVVRDRMFTLPQRTGGVDLTRHDVGLRLVQSVAEIHGGSVIVDSDVGRGTTFSLNLPIDCRRFVSGE